MINTSRTDFSDPTGTCEAVISIGQGIVLNLVCINLEWFNAVARGSQKLFSHELFDHVFFREALFLPEDREVSDCDSFGTSIYQA
jgi:hypothetical protein